MNASADNETQGLNELEGELQSPNVLTMLFQGENPYKKATDYLAFAKPRQVNLECGNIDRKFVVKLTMSREKA